MTTQIAEALCAVRSADAVVTDPETLDTYAHDDAEWAPYGQPAAVVFATCLVLSLEKMTRITEVNAAERYAVVEAGGINDDLRQHVAAYGLCCVKYGVTRDYVLGVTVVLADGSVARLGRTTAEGVTGYDLTALMVGSEGTLGIIVDVTLKLRPLAADDGHAANIEQPKAFNEALLGFLRAG